MPDPLSPAAIEQVLQSLEGWTHAEGAIRKTFTFASFHEAVAFLVRVAFAADAANHHPTLTNIYNRVTIALSTHDADNQVTAKDTGLATEIECFSWV